mmetsp:Transcript_16406/g.38003  ORF Transcript_16406/g.38003 Transcript_16406/m.38003 type:complete len:161 (+) Transcript_16406:106-588(+)|eukprot:CAMPEP_0172591230 /NCGR_PEP_ID=MMETSP1068-20121228/9910_1 /TAXON_ID=35684 /ORGANISM="Pseudopedinella elastica, Strain CCMP716" /LENGTH=160 /DNA_ID=CAMNT_0013387529 /DNA_START=99 /DNA_END=581 /DNA_ORIENTATION=+
MLRAVLVLGSLFHVVSGFTPQPAPRFLARPVLAAAPAPPETKIKQKTAPAQVKEKAKEKTVELAEPMTRTVTEAAEVPMWKVVLLGDEEYDEAYTIQTIQQVCVDITKQKAEQAFNEAQLYMKSELIVVPQEHAEHFVQQFQRCDPMVFATCEPENGEKQ